MRTRPTTRYCRGLLNDSIVRHRRGHATHFHVRFDNPIAEFSATRGLQPNDAPEFVRDQVTGETRDVMLVGHMPNLERVHALLLQRDDRLPFPLHGLVAMEFDERGWREVWRLV